MNIEEEFQKRLAFISDKNNKEEMKTLKEKHTFHFCKFEEGMTQWFDLWMRKRS